MTDQQSHSSWHMDRRFTIGNLLLVLALLGSVFLWLIALDKSVSAAHLTIGYMKESTNGQMVSISNQLREMNRKLERIDEKLDRKVDKGYGARTSR